MYDNQKMLRGLVQVGLKQKGYDVEVLKGTGGARLRLSKDGKTNLALVRTSSDRWLGWMRKEDGEWRGMGDGNLIIAAVLDSDEKPTKAEIYAFDPADVQKAFKDNLAAREASSPDLKKTAPIFVCMDETKGKGAANVGSNLKAKAQWKLELPLDAAPPAEEAPVSTAKPKESKESFAARVRQEFADLLGVSVENVSVEFKVSL
jgi:hypothetical protein